MKAEGGRMNKAHRGLKETIEATAECAGAVLYSVGYHVSILWEEL